MKVLLFSKKKKKSSFSDISDAVPSLGSSSQAAPDLGLPLRLASRLNPSDCDNKWTLIHSGFASMNNYNLCNIQYLKESPGQKKCSLNFKLCSTHLDICIHRCYMYLHYFLLID